MEPANSEGDIGSDMTASLTKSQLDELTELLPNVEDRFERIARELAKAADSEIAEQRSERLIAHFLGLTKTLDSRRESLFRSSLQMVAISLAGLGILVRLFGAFADPLSNAIYWGVIGGLVSLATTALLTISKYYWQTKSDRYHFLRLNQAGSPVTNSYRWFYHGVPSLSNVPYLDSRNRENDKEALEAILSGAEYFMAREVTIDAKTAVQENIKQAYLLLVHNAYKNKFDRQLIDYLSIGTAISGLLALLVGISVFFGGLP